MSTRMSIFYGTIGGTEYHLYRDGLDTDGVYLELDADEPLRIPNEVWEVIRRFQAIDISIADETDAEIRMRAAFVIETRMDRVSRERQQTGREHVLAELPGIMVYGPADDPVEEQIDRAIADDTTKREAARRVKAALAVGR